MSPRSYDWTRYWCPTTGTLPLTDEGFLLDPQSRLGKLLALDIDSFEEVLRFPCLALLGEPGIGKSHVLQSELPRLQERLTQAGDLLHSLNLRAYGEESRLCDDLFEAPTVRNWLSGTSRLHLFLDSMDEGLLGIEALATLLLDEISRRRLPVERLRIRIACRTAEWPSVLEEGLKERWGRKQFAAYELTPLRREDVAIAAAANDLDSEGFLREIVRADAVALAIRPITLGFLLDTYKESDRLLASTTELYREGCELLCVEMSPSRRAASRVGSISPKARLCVAERIAAVTMFSNRDAISTEPGRPNPVDAVANDLSGGSEAAEGLEFHVSAGGIREVLDTALFTSRGLGRLGWAHHTYPEFLAARYLTRRRVEPQKVLSFISISVGAAIGVIPQLRGTAAWLAAMNPLVLRELAVLDPPLMVDCDLRAAGDGERAVVVDALLGHVERNGSLGVVSGWRNKYARFRHGEIEEQLRTRITDPQFSDPTRELAIDIAEACGVIGLGSDLAAIAVNRREPERVRVAAASAVATLGEPVSCERLAGLASGDSDDDPHDSLKGQALRALWPRYITVQQLLPLLKAPKIADYFGSYYAFLEHEFAPKLTPSDLPAALKWVADLPRKHHLPRAFRKMADAILVKALESVDKPVVADALAAAVIMRAKMPDGLVEEHGDSTPMSDLLSDTQTRRTLILALVRVIGSDKKDHLMVSVAQPPVIRPADALWLLDRLEEETSPGGRCLLARFIRQAFDFENPDQADRVIGSSAGSPELAEVFDGFLESVPLGSPQADAMRQFYFGPLGPGYHDEPKPILDPPPAVRVKARLELCERDIASGWPLVIRELSLEETSTHYVDELKSDVTGFAGWRAADEITQGLIMDAALKYLRTQDAAFEEWMDVNQIHHRTVAGVRALLLLAKRPGERLALLDGACWRKWMPALMDVWPQGSDEGDPWRRDLLRTARNHAPQDFLISLGQIITRECKLFGHLTVIWSIEQLIDQELEDLLLGRLMDRQLAPGCMKELATLLCRRGNVKARSFLESLVANGPASRGAARGMSIIAAEVLFSETTDAAWGVVWPVVRKSPKLGRQIVSAWMDVTEWGENRMGRQLRDLKEADLADLIVWLERRFPQEPEAEPVGVRPIDSSISFRTFVLRRLTEYGTPAAVEALRSTMTRLPKLTWLRHHIREAEEHARRRAWGPPAPAHLLAAIADRDRRLIQDGSQLLDVLNESLERAEAELQGELPAAELLWDATLEARGRPKAEDSLSNYLARHLKRDLVDRGVVTNREVEVRHGRSGRGRGHSTDIYVNALAPGGGADTLEPLRAVIEVKGCWHRELLKAMQTQLVERYMQPARIQHGLYLVGWYVCDWWDPGDPRRSQVPEMSLEELRKKIASQAADLTRKHGTDVRGVVLNVART